MAVAHDLDIDLGIADGIVEEMGGGGGVTAANLIPLLQRLQGGYGYLPPPALAHVSERTGIPTSRMYGVITFYSQFFTEPHGLHTIRCCQGTACHVKGSMRVGDAIKEALGVDEGGTTKDMLFTFESVMCLGTCFLAPVMMIDNDYYGNLTPDKIKPILEKYTQEKT
jgi:NADH-quinone oxidoreductase subunit E